MPSYSFPMEKEGVSGSALRKAGNNNRITFESTLEWKKVLGQQNIAIVGGYSYEYYVTEEIYASNSNFISDDISYNNLGMGTYLAAGYADMDSYKAESKLSGFFARAVYNFSNKYFLSASIRREGSSKFGINERWGTFPAISAAWEVSQEEFFKPLSSLFEFLKIRAGYGITGNQGMTDFYVPIIRYGQDVGFFYYNGEQVRGYKPVSNANPNLKWETKAEFDLGFDWLALNSRLGGTVDYYIRDTRDLLMQYDVPVPPNLYEQTFANVASMRNSGIEISINTTPVKKSKFSWEVNFTFDYRKNKVLSIQNEYYKLEYRNYGDIGAPGISAWTHRLEEGQPIGNIHTYRFEAIDSLGKWVFADLDSSGGKSTGDRTVVGNGVPDFYLGLTNVLRYGKFDLSFMLRGMFGQQIINAKRIWHENPQFLPQNIMKSALNTNLWDAPEFSSYYVENGDFVKVDNITLGYTYLFKNNKYIRSFRLYGTVNNAFVFTNYTGLDPEVSFKGLEPGNDNRFDYPSVRTFVVGLVVKF
jgi:TonB-linked SusC/RagA family outer membrane protein